MNNNVTNHMLNFTEESTIIFLSSEDIRYIDKLKILRLYCQLLHLSLTKSIKVYKGVELELGLAYNINLIESSETLMTLSLAQLAYESS